MNINFLVVITAALIAVFGTIYTARVSLKNNQSTLRQSLDIRMREIAQENAQEAEDARQDERGSNLAEAKQIREELKTSREEMRADRDRMAAMLKAEQIRAIEVEQIAKLERSGFHTEILVLQEKQRDIDTERAHHKAQVDTLKKQHCVEITKYKRQLVALTAIVKEMEARVKELEASKPAPTGL